MLQRTAETTRRGASAPVAPRLLATSSVRVDPATVIAGIIVCTAFATSILWALVIPYGRAPDEGGHFEIDRYIAAHGRLPVFDRSPEITHTRCQGNTGPCFSSYANVPPGRSLLGAAVLKIHQSLTGSPYDELTRTPRLASALCMAAYVAFLYLSARALLPDPFAQVTAVLIGALIPQVTFLGAYTNDDSLGPAATAAVLYLVIVTLRDGLGRGRSVALGAALGALVLSKTNYYTAFVPFALCLLLRLRQEWREGAVRRFLAHLTLAGAVGAAVSGWWVVRGLALYGDPTGLLVLRRAYVARAPDYFAGTRAGQGDTMLSLLRDSDWPVLSFESFWGTFDYLSVRFAPPVYDWIKIAVAASLVGAVVGTARYLIARRGIAPVDHWRAEATLAVGALIPLVVLLSLWTSLTLDYQPQGRYLFPALTPIALLLASGAHGWSRACAYRAFIFGAVGLAMLSLNLYALLFVIAPAYYA